MMLLQELSSMDHTLTVASGEAVMATSWKKRGGGV